MAKKKRAPRPDSEKVIFEEVLEKVELAVQRLEEGQLGLTEAMAEYERGIRYLKLCYQALESAERRIELLSGIRADGQPVVQPFEDEALSLEEKHASRTKRRSRPKRASGNPPEEDDGVDVPGGLF